MVKPRVRKHFGVRLVMNELIYMQAAHKMRSLRESKERMEGEMQDLLTSQNMYASRWIAERQAISKVRALSYDVLI